MGKHLEESIQHAAFRARRKGKLYNTSAHESLQTLPAQLCQWLRAALSTSVALMDRLRYSEFLRLVFTV